MTLVPENLKKNTKFLHPAMKELIGNATFSYIVAEAVTVSLRPIPSP